MPPSSTSNGLSNPTASSSARSFCVGGSAGDLFGRRRVFLDRCRDLRHRVQPPAASRKISTNSSMLAPFKESAPRCSLQEASPSSALPSPNKNAAGPSAPGPASPPLPLALGPVLGGWLIEHASWRWIFFINLPLAVAVIVISLWHVPESHGPAAKRLDFLGALLVTLGLGGLVYGLVESPRLGWTDPGVAASLLLALVCLSAFPIVEARAPNPDGPAQTLPITKLLRREPAHALSLLGLGNFFFMFPMNLIQVQHYSATAAGAAALPAHPAHVRTLPLVRRTGHAHTAPSSRSSSAPLIGAAGFSMFALPSVGGSYWTTFFPAFVVLGFGMAVSVAPLTTTVMTAVDRDHSGTASGINNAVARVAGLLAVAVFGIVMVNAFAAHLDHELERLDIPQQIREQLHSDRTKLAGIGGPSGRSTHNSSARAEFRCRQFLHRTESHHCQLLRLRASASSPFAARPCR